MNMEHISGRKDLRKKIVIGSLSAVTMIIMFLGMFFSAFCVINNISIKVLGASVHGAVFGLLVLYLGLRYYFMVVNLKPEVYKSSASFSWKNFKKERCKNKLSYLNKIYK